MDNFFFIAVARAAGGSIEDATPLTTILINALQFLLSIVGIVGIIGMVIAGVWYLTAGGDEKQMQIAKRVVVSCLIGIGVALSALIIVSQMGTWFV
ncbi:MAG: hypothetical protein KBD27_02765 [Candidatus Moranbacteria bacterium]|nr:hypothetical protein [Candidatus Moranbacteria bacterium]